MKKLVIISLVSILLFAMAACQKDQGTSSSNGSISAIGVDSTTFGNHPKTLTSMTESMVIPQFGKPNSTYYAFKVLDVSGALALSVKLYEKATGTTTYLPMSRTGNYWTLSQKIIINGWYDWRYVYSVSKANISSNTYTLCNTNNVFSSTGISSISWPFGADGSSYGTGWASSCRTVIANGILQSWRGGEEGGNGDGWGDGYHTGTSEYYSDDWNRGNGNQDLGAEVRSPLDGYVSAYGTYTTTLGQSKYVAIVQETSGNTYRFYVGHLNAIESSLYVGKYVRAGITKIGTVGMTGASSPHAHTNLRNVTNNASTSVKFYFNAN